MCTVWACQPQPFGPGHLWWTRGKELEGPLGNKLKPLPVLLFAGGWVCSAVLRSCHLECGWQLTVDSERLGRAGCADWGRVADSLWAGGFFFFFLAQWTSQNNNHYFHWITCFKIKLIKLSKHLYCLSLPQQAALKMACLDVSWSWGVLKWGKWLWPAEVASFPHTYEIPELIGNCAALSDNLLESNN